MDKTIRIEVLFPEIANLYGDLEKLYIRNKNHPAPRQYGGDRRPAALADPLCGERRVHIRYAGPAGDGILYEMIKL